MAKGSDEQDRPPRGSRADAVRAAVDQAFHAGQAQVSRERDRAQRQAQGVFEELTHVVARARETLDELRPSSGEELRELRDGLEALERRVVALERQGQGSTAGRSSRGRSSSARS
ncbi:MAG TPA: hypothetical protein VGV40_04490 [Solirubrobacteraceae bacterium]|nr:hypothetical protein [Solirubrobacteraceae bacterium]